MNTYLENSAKIKTSLTKLILYYLISLENLVPKLDKDWSHTTCLPETYQLITNETPWTYGDIYTETNPLVIPAGTIFTI